MQLGISHCRYHSGGIGVALPVSTHHHAVLTITISAGKYLVSTVWIDLHHQECRTPAQQRMTRGEGLVGIELPFIFWRQGMLIKADEGSRAAIKGLWILTDTVAGGGTLEQHLIDLRCILLADLQAEGLFKLLQDGSQTIDSITLGLISTFLILTHLLAPEVSAHVIGESHRSAVWRTRHEKSHVGHLVGGEIGIDGLCFLCIRTCCCHHDGCNHYK